MELVNIISDRLVQHTNTDFVRYLYDEIAWNNRLIGIVGAKGTGTFTFSLNLRQRDYAVFHIKNSLK